MLIFPLLKFPNPQSSKNPPPNSKNDTLNCLEGLKTHLQNRFEQCHFLYCRGGWTKWAWRFLSTLWFYVFSSAEGKELSGAKKWKQSSVYRFLQYPCFKTVAQVVNFYCRLFFMDKALEWYFAFGITVLGRIKEKSPQPLFLFHIE